MQVHFSEEDGAGPAQPLDHDRILALDGSVQAQPGAGRCPRSCHVQDVLDRYRHAVERPKIHAVRELQLCGGGGGECGIRQDREENVQAGVQVLDPLEDRLRHLERRDQPGPVQPP